MQKSLLSIRLRPIAHNETIMVVWGNCDYYMSGNQMHCRVGLQNDCFSVKERNISTGA